MGRDDKHSAPTPRTDAAAEKPTFESYTRLAGFARQLERELADITALYQDAQRRRVEAEDAAGRLGRELDAKEAILNNYRLAEEARSARTPTDQDIEDLAAKLDDECITKEGDLSWIKAILTIREWCSKINAAPQVPPSAGSHSGEDLDPTGAAPSSIERPNGHDAAKERIAACVREIQIIADEFGYDQSEWLADDEAAPSATKHSIPVLHETATKVECDAVIQRLNDEIRRVDWIRDGRPRAMTAPAERKEP
jgi:hypothetical protein